MVLLSFVVGGMFGMVGMSIFSSRAYNKGFNDASNLYEMMLNGSSQED